MVNEKHLFLAAIVILLAFIGLIIVESGNKPPQTNGNGGSCGPNGCSGANMPIGDPSTKEFVITASKFKFEPSNIEVNKGDKVRITLKNIDVAHGIAISGFGVDIKAGPGEQKTAEFVANKAGTFNMFCSVYCGEGHPEMSGKLIVNDKSLQQNSPTREVQVITLRGTPFGYDKSKIQVKAGLPIRLDFSADPAAGCGRQVIVDNVGVNLVSKSGGTVSATFTPPVPGVYKYHCSMNMFRGEIVAV